LGWVLGVRDRETRDNACTGTLLLHRFVLTAAHCITREDYVEVVGGLFDVDNSSEPRQSLPVKKVHFRKDFALIELQREAPYPSLCLFHPGRPLPPSPKCFVAGWHLNLSAKWHGKLKYAPIDVDTSDPEEKRKFVSTGARKTKACLADMGSALFCGEGRAMSLVGVVTRRVPDCAHSPSLFTNTLHYGAWIHGTYINSLKYLKYASSVKSRPKRAAARRRSSRRKNRMELKKKKEKKKERKKEEAA
jgi:secreted trypsin-like serine protease